MQLYDLQIIIEQDEDGLYVAECPALQGCYAQGQTTQEAIENIKDVIAMCIQEMREEHRETNLKFPAVIGIERVEVQV